MWRRHSDNRKPGDSGQCERKTSTRCVGITSLAIKTCRSPGGARAGLHHDEGFPVETAAGRVVKTQWATDEIQALSEADNLALGGMRVGLGGEFSGSDGPTAL